MDIGQLKHELACQVKLDLERTVRHMYDLLHCCRRWVARVCGITALGRQSRLGVR